MTDVPSARDTPLRQLYAVEYVASLRKTIDSLRNRRAELETQLRARIAHAPKPPSSQSELEARVAMLERKLRSDSENYEEQIHRLVQETATAQREAKRWKDLQWSSQSTMFNIMRALDKSLGGTGIVSSKKRERLDERGLMSAEANLDERLLTLRDKLWRERKLRHQVEVKNRRLEKMLGRRGVALLPDPAPDETPPPDDWKPEDEQLPEGPEDANGRPQLAAVPVEPADPRDAGAPAMGREGDVPSPLPAGGADERPPEGRDRDAQEKNPGAEPEGEDR